MAYLTHIPIPAEEITKEQLFAAFSAANDVYGYGLAKEKILAIRTNSGKEWLELLRRHAAVHYRTEKGSKFFVKGSGSETIFWGFGFDGDAEQQQKDVRFKEALKKIFSLERIV